jgi:hypothetical protein
MYMHVYHVYASICMYVAASILDPWPNCLQVRICTYMYVFDCICMYMSYMHVCVLVYACISWNDTLRHGNRCQVLEAQSLGAALQRQLAAHTQGTIEHLSVHFFQPSANVGLTRFGTPLPTARVQGT